MDLADLTSIAVFVQAFAATKRSLHLQVNKATPKAGRTQTRFLKGNR